MSADKWETKEDLPEDRKLYVYLLISRNKDNKNLKNFQERKTSFLAYEHSHRVRSAWSEFVNNARNGEMCRLYRSVNSRDPQKIKKMLMMNLIMDEHFDIGHMDSKLAGIAANKECAAESKWLFDFDKNDYDARNVSDFEWDIMYENNGEEIIDEDYRTPHGYGIVVKHGFDTRKLMEKWGDIVTLKRDDMMLLQWETKRSETDE